MVDWELGALHEPPPPVDWDDVRFDWLAAREAAVACEQLARLVREVAGWHHRSSVRLLDTWRGVLAEVFDEHHHALRTRLLRVEEQLLAQAANLRGAADDALGEQLRRERQRRAWRDWDARRRLEQRLSA